MSIVFFLHALNFQETLESLVKHANYQRKMFDQAVQLVRPGGVIVYSTWVQSFILAIISLACFYFYI